jgi:hypothetical protein
MSEPGKYDVLVLGSGTRGKLVDMRRNRNEPAAPD